MNLRWKAVMKNGDVVEQNGSPVWPHIHQVDIDHLDIVADSGKVLWTLKFQASWFSAETDSPVQRRYRCVTDGLGNLHVIQHPGGVTIVSERDGSVKTQADFGGDFGHKFSEEGRGEFLAKNPKPARAPAVAPSVKGKK